MSETSAYERFVRPLLFSLDPEAAHHLAIGCLRYFSALIPKTTLTHPTNVFGLKFRNPVGLAAGFDKNAVALKAWEALGFGFIEIGTVTAQAQPGNPPPRIFRYREQGALINRLGFNNDGAEMIAQRLRNFRARNRWPNIPVGINIGKSKATPLENAAEDYLFSFRMLHEFADYVVLNVSSPNTPGLRTLQEHEALVALLRTITREGATKPILLKIAPDLSDSDLATIIVACEENGVAGIVATNTTLDHAA
nr:quinone-dependent dihydroorotate dehydrogenase [Verrucomicrobiota bacterium]